jgi:hypothetical protein
MPAASIELDISVGTPTAGVHPVTYTILSQSEFGTLKLLLLRQGSNVLDRLCTLYDIGDYPEVSTPGVEFYRASTVTVNYTSTDKGYNGVEEMKNAVQFLVEAMAYYRSKLADEVFTYSATW